MTWGPLAGARFIARPLDLFLDDFNGAAVDTNNWTRVDTESKISVANGLLSFSGGLATPAHGDPMVAYTKGITRAAGLTLNVKARNSATNTIFQALTLTNTLSITNVATDIEHLLYFKSTGVLATYRLGVDTPSGVAYSANTWKYLRLVLDATGCRYYASDDGITYSLLGTDAAGSVATLYPAIYSYNAAGDVDYIRIR